MSQLLKNLFLPLSFSKGEKYKPIIICGAGGGYDCGYCGWKKNMQACKSEIDEMTPTHHYRKVDRLRGIAFKMLLR